MNPGFARRFAVEDAFHFEDFTDEELRKILDYKIKLQDLYATDSAKDVAIEVLNRRRNRPNFGNAGEVENLLSKAKTAYQNRRLAITESHRSVELVLQPQDFDPDFDRVSKSSGNIEALFSDLIGQAEICQQFEAIHKTCQKMKARGIALSEMCKQVPTNFVFKGPPGRCPLI